MSNFWLKREARTSYEGLSRRGYVYQGRASRNLAGGATASAAFTTGDTPTVVYLREISSTATPLTFRLFEVSAASGLSGSVQGQNLNRLVGGSASASQAVISASVSGATVVTDLAGDVVGGSGGKSICTKVRTLAPDTTYLLQFENNAGATSTVASVTILWSEGEPEPYDSLG
jgi:hypothetical protein